MLGAVDQTIRAHGEDATILRLVQKASRGSTISQLLLAAPAVIAWIVPIVLCAHAAADPQTLDIISDRPFAAGQIGLAFAVWSLIFGLPLVTLSKRIGTSRSIEIDAETVRVVDTTWLRTRHWQAPLASYQGVAQHVRTTLSGVEHDVMLVHPDPAKNVILAQSHRSVQAALDELKALLRLPEVSAANSNDRAGAAPLRSAIRDEPVQVGSILHAA